MTLPKSEVIKKRAAALGVMSYTLAHISIVDQIWQSHLLGVEHGFRTRTTESPASLDLLVQQINRLGDWYIKYADAVTEEMLN